MSTTTDGSSSTSRESNRPTIAFSDWLRPLADGPPPVRDLAQDFIMGADEGSNGSYYQTPESFLEMLEGEGACDAAIRTFHEAAHEWSELTGVPLTTEDEDKDQ
jgi:hypothetical protein